MRIMRRKMMIMRMLRLIMRINIIER